MRTTAPVIYVIDSPEHPFDVRSVQDLATTIVTVPIADWRDALTPWAAAGIYREEPPFGGHAARTLAKLCGETIPALEAEMSIQPHARAICGYSLGGLFALYALTHSDTFRACACLSGSVWYEGWVEYLRELDVDLRDSFAFLSVGTKEKRAARPLLRTVERNMEECARILERDGCTVRYQTSPGGHMQHVAGRFEAGLRALDDALKP